MFSFPIFPSSLSFLSVKSCLLNYFLNPFFWNLTEIKRNFLPSFINSALIDCSETLILITFFLHATRSRYLWIEEVDVELCGWRLSWFRRILRDVFIRGYFKMVRCLALNAKLWLWVVVELGKIRLNCTRKIPHNRIS